jgi:hypothetical protein
MASPHDSGPYDPDVAYRDAVDTLTDALVQVWVVCERNARATGTRHGTNLPEALSYALGLTANALGLDPGPIHSDDTRHEAATEGLVRHRPGSWEAAAVRPLIFPIAWLPEPHSPGQHQSVVGL